MTVLRHFQIRRSNTPLVLALILGAVAPATMLAQNVATVRVEENLRAAPQGTIIGRLMEGTALPVVRVEGNWVLVNVQGWVWTQSLQSTDRQGFDLTISASPRENLRAEPSGPILGRLLEGALLNREEDIPAWTRVSREAWVWGQSLDLEDRSGQSRISTPPASGDWWRSGSGGAPVLTGPDGDTLALTRPGTELAVLARQGNWVRVRLEGWAWAPAGGDADSVDVSVVTNVTAEEVSGDPESYRGAVVEWELQFVSMEEAERVRTDFYEGEPFLLTRANAQSRVFVYVAIPPERLSEVEGLIPLERIRVVGRIRTGAAALTGNPILDLLELTRLRRN